MNIAFRPREWLRASLGEADHSPLSVDDFELGQAMREVRLGLSQESSVEKRSALSEELRAQSVGNADFMRLVGDAPGKSFQKLLGSANEMLLYTPGGALDQPSKIRDALLEILAGVESESHGMYAARVLAAMVGPGAAEKKLALAQIDHTLSSLAAALKRLPPSTANRVSEGTTNPTTAKDLEKTLELTRARIRQPEIAAAIDDLTVVKNRTFRYATLANVGISQSAFHDLTQAAKAAVKSGQIGAARDIDALWSAAKSVMGQSGGLQNGFAGIEYSGDPSGPSFAADVEKLETLLRRAQSFKPGVARPAQ